MCRQCAVMARNQAEAGGTRWDETRMTYPSKIKRMAGNGDPILGAILSCQARIPPWALRKSLQVPETWGPLRFPTPDSVARSQYQLAVMTVCDRHRVFGEQIYELGSVDQLDLRRQRCCLLGVFREVGGRHEDSGYIPLAHNRPEQLVYGLAPDRLAVALDLNGDGRGMPPLVDANCLHIHPPVA